MTRKKFERRVSVRQPFCQEVPYVLGSESGVGIFSARSRDISTDGVGLLLNCAYEPGTLLNLGLTSRTGLFARNLVLRVARVVPLENGTYLVGGAFITKLDGEELHTLLT